METNDPRSEQAEERSFKKALLNRYLEDQVLYNRYTQKSKLSNYYENLQHSPDEEDDEDEVFERIGNDVIVKITDEESDFNKNPISKREKTSRTSTNSHQVLDVNDNQLLNNLSAQAKFSRSLDERQFNSLHLDIPSHCEQQSFQATQPQSSDFLKSKSPVRKYSDCSSNYTRNFTPTYSTRLSAEDASFYGMQDHPARMVPRGFKKKISLPGPGLVAQKRLLGCRKPALSLSCFDCSIQNTNGGNEANRMSMSSFKSSCSSFVEVEFGDSDYDRSCTSSPCSPLTGGSRFPPIGNDN